MGDASLPVSVLGSRFATAPMANSVQQEIEEFRNSLLKMGGNSLLVRRILMIPERIMVRAAMAVKQAGLLRWIPHILGDPDSLYNVTHRFILVSQFQIALANRGFEAFGVTADHIYKDTALEVLYDNYLHSYLKRYVRQDLIAPGGAEAAREKEVCADRCRDVRTFLMPGCSLLTLALADA